MTICPICETRPVYRDSGGEMYSVCRECRMANRELAKYWHSIGMPISQSPKRPRMQLRVIHQVAA